MRVQRANEAEFLFTINQYREGCITYRECELKTLALGFTLTDMTRRLR